MKRWMVWLLCWACSGVAMAGDVVVQDAWLRAPAPGQDVAGVYLTIECAQVATLTGAQSSVAGTVQLHRMSMQQGVMRMQQVAGIRLPAGQVVHLAPGGLHIMLIHLKQPLHSGDSVPLVLDVTVGDKAEHIDIQAVVRGFGDSQTGKMVH